MKIYTEEAREKNSVNFSAIDCQCGQSTFERPVTQTNISHSVSRNRSPLLDTLRSNTESTGALPSVAGANVNCVLDILATII